MSKKLSFLFFVLLISILIIFLIYVPKSCKKFSFSIDSKCKSHLKSKILWDIKENQFLYELVRSIYLNQNKENFNKTKILINKTLETDEILKKPNDIKGIEGNDNFVINSQNLPYSETDEWTRSHGGNYNLKYSNTSQIKKENLKNLKLLWEHRNLDDEQIKTKWTHSIQINPIYLNGKLITVLPGNKLIAFNPNDGDVIWEFSSDKGRPTRRGITGYVDKKGNEYIFIGFGKNLFKLNSKDGLIDKKFGQKGSIIINAKTAPLVFEDKLILAGLKTVEIFDLSSGKFISKINLHEKKNIKFSGIVWGGSALDEKNGLLFVTTGNPKPGTYGVDRPGKNERSNSVIAIDLLKNKVAWSFQEIIHDLWDLDLASPPIIHDLKLNNKIYETIIVNTKAGNTLILDRKTGKSLFDVEFMSVPKSNLPGEIASSYQIKINYPEKFSKIDFQISDTNKLSIQKQKEIEKKLVNAKFGLFETPSLIKDLIIFGLHGGAQWHGSALDPINQHLYVPVNNVPWRIRPFLQDTSIFSKFTPKDFKIGKSIYRNKCSSCHGLKRNGKQTKDGEKYLEYIPSLVGLTFEKSSNNSNFLDKNLLINKHKNLDIQENEILEIYKYFKWKDNYLNEEGKIIVRGSYKSWSQFLTSDDLPASNPPWGYIAKIDLNNGKLIFKAPIGYEEIDGKKKLIGTTIFGGIAVNKSKLIFANGTADNKAYVLDAESGEILWEYQMEAAGSAPPIIFSHNGKEYISFVSTGGGYFSYKDKGSTIYTFGIK